MNAPDLTEAGRRMRALTLQFDALGEQLRERGFEEWCRDTLFPQAVNRWIVEAGAQA